MNETSTETIQNIDPNSTDTSTPAIFNTGSMPGLNRHMRRKIKAMMRSRKKPGRRPYAPQARKTQDVSSGVSDVQAQQDGQGSGEGAGT